MKQEFKINLNKLSEKYPNAGYTEILDYNINEYFLNKNISNQNSKVSSITKFKVWLRDKLYYKQSLARIKKLGLANPVILFMGNSIDDRELLPLYQELQKESVDCFIVTNKHHIYKQLAKKYNVLYLPVLKSENKTPVSFIAADYIDENVKQIIKVNIEKNIDWREKVEKIVNSLKPSLYVSTNDLLPEQRIFTYIANAKNVDTICQQHGTINKGSVMAYSNSKYWFAYGEHSKDILIELGYKSENIFVTGSSYLERYLDNTIKKANRKEGLESQKDIFLILLSGKGQSTTQKNYELQLEAIKQLIENNTDKEFIIKLHPKEIKEAYTEFVQANCMVISHNEFVNSKQNLMRLISASKGVITGISASIFEAIILEKPVFTIDCMNEYGKYDLIQNNISIHSTNKQQLKENFREFIKEPMKFSNLQKEAKEYALKYFNVEGETSAKKKVKIIKQILS